MKFHLAIPTHDLKVAKEFYQGLGFDIGREYPTHIIVKFYSCQLVLHLDPDACDKDARMYPRHFGVIFARKQYLLAAYEKMKKKKLLWQDLFVRGAGGMSHHMTFFIKDPSNNLIEFKYYRYKRAIF